MAPFVDGDRWLQTNSPRLAIVTEPNISESKRGRFLRVEAYRETVLSTDCPVYSTTLIDKVDDGPGQILFMTTSLQSEELVVLLRDFRWSYECIYMTAESAEKLLPLFLRPTVLIDVGDYTPSESVSEFKSTLILD